MTILHRSSPRLRSALRSTGTALLSGLLLCVSSHQTLLAQTYLGGEPRFRLDQPVFLPYDGSQAVMIAEPVVDDTFGQGTIALTSTLQPMPPAPPTVTAAPVPAGPGSTEATTYGDEPEDFNIQFLRGSTVLLEPGQWQFDYGLIYAKDDYHHPISVLPVGTARADVKRRMLQVPFALRYGWSDRVQMTASLPVGWSHREFSSVGLFDETDNHVGIGDLELGLNYHWIDGCYGYTPDVILNFGLTVPTGEGEFPVNGISQAALANGVWAPSVQLMFIQRYDPLVFFYGVGYRYLFEESFSGFDVEYGSQFSYNLGVGFAVNDRVTLSTAFLGLFQTETLVNGEGVPGSMREPLRLRFAATAYRHGRIIEPFAEIGMTENAADSIIGIVWTL